MQRTSFDHMACSVARTLDVIGEWWTPLIVRDLFLGISRFDAIQRDLGLSRKVLAERLAKLVDHGIVERAPYQDNPRRYDYWLTEKGQDLAGVLIALQAWGDRWVADEEGPPLVFRHDTCGAITTPVPTCSHCGRPLLPEDITPLPGPGARQGPGTTEVPAALDRIAAMKGLT